MPCTLERAGRRHLELSPAHPSGRSQERIVAETLPTAAPLPMRRSRPFDPPEEYTRLRTEHPVSPLAFPDGKVGWLLTRYEDVRAVLADTRFSSRRALGSSPIRRIQLRPEELQVRPGSF